MGAVSLSCRCKAPCPSACRAEDAHGDPGGRLAVSYLDLRRLAPCRNAFIIRRIPAVTERDPIIPPMIFSAHVSLKMRIVESTAQNKNNIPKSTNPMRCIGVARGLPFLRHSSTVRHERSISSHRMSRRYISASSRIRSSSHFCCTCTTDSVATTR